MTFYEWTVRFMHFRNSFAKTKTVEAADYEDAVKRAMVALAEGGYDVADFGVTDVHRGPVVEAPPPEIGSDDSLAAYFASDGKVYATRPGGEAEEVGTALTANGGELERFDVALDLARKQRETKS